MKLTKRLMSFLLVIVMVIGLNVTAFAATPGVVNLTVNDSTTTINETFTTLPAINRPNTPNNAEYPTTCTAADILLKYAADNNGSVVSNWDQVNLNLDGTAGLYITSYFGKNTYNTYYDRGIDPATGEYVYRWTGAYWQLQIDGIDAYYYSTHYPINLTNGMDIGFNYINDPIGFVFTTPYPIAGAIPEIDWTIN